MDELSKTMAKGLISSYRDALQRVHTLSEKFSEEQFWAKPYSYGNSFGHLTLHLIGNLNYYIGAQNVVCSPNLSPSDPTLCPATHLLEALKRSDSARSPAPPFGGAST